MSSHRAGDRERTLLLISPFFPPEGGGLERYVLQLGGEISRRGHWRVVVATSGVRRGRLACEQEGELRIYRLPWDLQVSNTRLGLRWRRHLKAVIAAEHPCLVNAHGPVPGLADAAALLAGDIPLVITWHAGSMRKGHQPVDGAIGIYERAILPRMLGRASSVIASSETVGSWLAPLGASFITTVTPGVDAAVFTPAARRPAGAVLFVGGLNRGDAHKGLESLLSAVATLRAKDPNVHLSVVGAGQDLPRYALKCQALGIAPAVSFLGRLNGGELVRAYQSAGVLALPTRNDSFPMVLLEAMACGLPVISTVVGGIPSLVTDGEDGFLIDPGDEAALVDRLGRIVDDASLGDRLGRHGREKAASRFGWDQQAAATEAIFDAALRSSPARRERTWTQV